jgi:hypothetical protein
MLLEISKWRRVKPPSEIYRPGNLLPYTLRGISRKYALLLGQCGDLGFFGNFFSESSFWYILLKFTSDFKSALHF